MTMPVAVLGAAGRMGQAACAAIEQAPDLALAAALGRSDSRESLVKANVEVAVDLTHPDSVMDNVAFCVRHRIPVVAGTSGFTEERLATMRQWLAEERAEIGIFVVPNFSVGAVLMMRFAEHAAHHLAAVEIVESHHPRKIDAPSGTAHRTAELIAAARRAAGHAAPPDATSQERAGARGASIDDVRVHSVRLPGLVAHQEVVFGGEAETLTLRHDSFDRSSFMPGLLLAIRRVPQLTGVTVGLDHVL